MSIIASTVRWRDSVDSVKLSCATARSSGERFSVLMWLKHSSTGFIVGEYTGVNTYSIPAYPSITRGVTTCTHKRTCVQIGTTSIRAAYQI